MWIKESDISKATIRSNHEEGKLIDKPFDLINVLLRFRFRLIECLRDFLVIAKDDFNDNVSLYTKMELVYKEHSGESYDEVKDTPIVR